MYKRNKHKNSGIKSYEVEKGVRTLEQKIEVIVSNKEPIQAETPEIFQERNAGVEAAYNIRTDRWDIAADGMDVVERNRAAKRDAMHIVRGGGEVDAEGKEIIPNDEGMKGEGGA